MKFLKQKNISKWSVSDNTLITNHYGRAIMDIDGALRLPKGSTGRRPDISGVRIPNGANGYLRYNTDTNVVEAYIAGTWQDLSGGEFDDLSDVYAASLTVDKIYLPATTMLIVQPNGISAYRFDQYGTADDPIIYAISGTTIAFNLQQATGHPFLIQDPGGTNYDTGLVHVTTAGIVTTGASAQGKTSGTLYWKIPSSISGDYIYQCQSHSGMAGLIRIKDITLL